MAERRKNRKKKEQTEAIEDDKKPSKQEYAVAKYLRQKLPEKKTTLLGHKVEYFVASRAIDCLLDSPFAKKENLFTSRESVIEYMDRMLQHKFFHRAKKIIVQKDSKKKKKESEETSIESGKEKEHKKTKEKEEGTEKNEEKKESEDTTEKKKEKKKIKLDMHFEQLFLDGSEVYVWIYDPIPMRTWIFGMLMVIGAVLVCLFPLWPQTIRHYIYYLSVAAAFFLVFIIGLAVVRLVVFVLIWLVTLGKHHLWLLPNLTEDVGFFESFWPLYKYEYKGSKDKKKKETCKSEKESNESIKEKESDGSSKEKEINGSSKEKEIQEKDSCSDKENKGDQKHESDSESEKAKVDSPDNGFEILDVDDMIQDDKEVKTEQEKKDE